MLTIAWEIAKVVVGKYWRHLAIAGAVVGLLLWARYAWVAHNESVWNAGYAAAVAEYDKVMQDHQNQARAAIIKTSKKYEKQIEDVATKGDSGDVVGGRISDALDFLRDQAQPSH